MTTDSAHITPYREAAIVTAKPKSGFIIRPKPHSCNKPGPFILVWYWLTRKTITHRSLWRCGVCGIVWSRDGAYIFASFAWDISDERHWTDAGGTLE